MALSGLCNLRLDGNQIVDLRLGAFKGLSLLISLDLSFNSITSIQKGALGDLSAV